MEKNEIIAILNDWNFWDKSLDTGIPRDFYLEKLKLFLSSGQAIVIKGPRRSGKSFLMRQVAGYLLKEKEEAKNILMVNFEDPRFTELDVNILQKIYETYLEFLSPKKTPYIFLDEIQEVENWEKWVRSMHELKKANIVLSGSNARLLSMELATLLTGRHLDLMVFPLSFKEFLMFKDLPVTAEMDRLSKNIEIKSFLREYIETGSFPEVALHENKKEILLNYFDDIVTKDLIRRFKVRKSEKLKTLAKFYMANISTLTTFSSVEKFLGISADTVEKFSGYFESAYLFFFLKRFSFKVKEQEKSPRKVYAVDTGLANAAGFRFSENIGKLAENAVFLQLKRAQSLNSNMDIYYWKDERHREVDFVIKEGLRVTNLIQVCWQLNLPKVKERELKPLLKAMEEFDLSTATVITDEYEANEDIKGKTIRFIPLCKWLLEQ